MRACDLPGSGEGAFVGRKFRERGRRTGGRKMTATATPVSAERLREVIDSIGGPGVLREKQRRFQANMLIDDPNWLL